MNEFWSYVNSSTIEVVGDFTAKYLPNQLLRLAQGGATKFFVVVSVALVGGNTRLTIDGAGVFTLTNEAISDGCMAQNGAHQGVPFGFDGAAHIGGVTEKLALADGDTFAIRDSSSPFGLAKVTYAKLKSALVAGYRALVNFHAGAKNYKIATLPASYSGSFDHILISFVADGDFTGANKADYSLFFSNRGGFTYRWTSAGANVTGSGIRCYQEADGAISIWIYQIDSYIANSYTVIDSLQATIISDPVAGSPTGTLVFDSTQPATYKPYLLADNSGNVTIPGTLSANAIGGNALGPIARTGRKTPSEVQNNTTLASGLYDVDTGLYGADGQSYVLTGWWHVLNFHHHNNNGYNSQIAVPLAAVAPGEDLYWRHAQGGTWSDWRRILSESTANALYAAIVHSHNNLGENDTRNSNFAPQAYPKGVQVDFKQNSVDGLDDGNVYHGVISYRRWQDWSGGGITQLGFTDNHNIWVRGALANDSWSSWVKLCKATHAHTGGDGAAIQYLGAIQQGYHASFKHYPNVASRVATVDAQEVGAWIIHSPLSRTGSEMFVIRVHGYLYGLAKRVDFTAVGYTYGGGTGNVDGQPGSVIAYSIVDLGNDDWDKWVGIDANGNLAIALGSTASSVYMGRLSVDLYATRFPVAGYLSNWSIDLSTTSGFGWKDIHGPLGGKKLVTSGDSHAHTGGAGAQIDHGSQAGLGDDDHTCYALLAGRPGGQVQHGYFEFEPTSFTSAGTTSQYVPVVFSSQNDKGTIFISRPSVHEGRNWLGHGIVRITFMGFGWGSGGNGMFVITTAFGYLNADASGGQVPFLGKVLRDNPGMGVIVYLRGGTKYYTNGYVAVNATSWTDSQGTVFNAYDIVPGTTGLSKGVYFDEDAITPSGMAEIVKERHPRGRLAVASDGTIWVLSTATHSLLRWNGSAWEDQGGLCSAISAASSTVCYVIGTDNQVWRRTYGVGWECLTGLIP